MDPENQSNYQQQNSTQQNAQLILPNSMSVMMLGILSILFCWIFGFLSMVLGVVSLIQASAGEKLYLKNPGLYSESSYKNLKTGKICAIIGLCLGALSMLLVLVVFLVFGAVIFSFFNYSLN